jgi:hypothetical protein
MYRILPNLVHSSWLTSLRFLKLHPFLCSSMKKQFIKDYRVRPSLIIQLCWACKQRCEGNNRSWCKDPRSSWGRFENGCKHSYSVQNDPPPYIQPCLIALVSVNTQPLNYRLIWPVWATFIFSTACTLNSIFMWLIGPVAGPLFESIRILLNLEFIFGLVGPVWAAFKSSLIIVQFLIPIKYFLHVLSQSQGIILTRWVKLWYFIKSYFLCDGDTCCSTS